MCKTDSKFNLNFIKRLTFKINRFIFTYLILLFVQYLYLVDGSSNILLKKNTYLKDQSKSIVSKNGALDYSLSDLDDFFFEVEYPEDIRYTYRIRTAKGFGSSFTKTFKKAKLIVAEPYQACGTLMYAERVRGNIALIERGECSFLTKAITAENAGAVAVLISDNDPSSDSLVDMIGDNTDRISTLPAAFLTWKDGYMIKKSIERLTTKSATINIPLNLTLNSQHIIRKAPWAFW